MREAFFKAKLLICIPALLCYSTVAQAANFATCLLDRLPGAANDVAATAALQVCLGTYPTGFLSVKQGAGRGWFGYKTGADCTLAKAGNTRSVKAAGLIGAACHKLYDDAPQGLQPYDG